MNPLTGASTPIPSKRKKPPIINQWYLTLYLRNQRRWFLLLAVGSLGYACVTGITEIREKYGALALPLLALPTLWLVASLILQIQRSRQELDKGQKSVHPIDAATFDSFLERVTLPPELAESGYGVVKGGVARDLYKHGFFAGYSATSLPVNRELRRRTAAGLSPCNVEPLEEARVLGSSPIGAWITRQLVQRLGWQWWLVRRWPLPDLAKEIYLPIIQALPAYSSGKLANEMKIRLVDDLIISEVGGPPLKLERTDYLSDLVTGHITGVAVRDKLGHDIFDGYVGAYRWSDGRPVLKPLRQSGCSNQIGVSGMALGVSWGKPQGEGQYSNGSLYIVGQSMQNLASAGLLAPSGSGSLDWSDYTHAGDRFVEAGMLREMLEETWAGSWSSLMNRGHRGTVITGYGRMLHRGGKPEFYGLTVMPRDDHEFGIDASELDFAADCFVVPVQPLTSENLVKVASRFLLGERARLSHPLFMSLTLLIEYVQQEPAQFEAMVAVAASYWFKHPVPVSPSARPANGSGSA